MSSTDLVASGGRGLDGGCGFTCKKKLQLLYDLTKQAISVLGKKKNVAELCIKFYLNIDWLA